MDIFGMHKSLLEKWDTRNMEDCLVQEVYELRETHAETLKLVVDLLNRVRHLEYQACPIQNAGEGVIETTSDVVKKKF